MGRKFGREMCGVLPFRSDKTGTLHPTMSAVPLPDATLTRLIMPTHCFYTDNFSPTFLHSFI